MQKATTVDEFLKMIFEKTKEDSDDPFNIFWFRGEIDYPETYLTPNAYRDFVEKFNNSTKKRKYVIGKNEKPYLYIEQNIRAIFDRKALPLIVSKDIENTAWNRYFLMQHYNAKTRLLDWTEDAIKALFFAVKSDTEKEKDKDAKVWILRPFELNRFTINEIFDRKEDLFVIPPLSNDNDEPQDLLNENNTIRFEELTRRYLTMNFTKEEKYKDKKYYPLAIYPPFLDERMTAQKACFTIFGNVNHGKLHDIIDNYSSEDQIIDYVVIDGKSKKKILSQLRLIGIDDSSVYPDLDGLGMSLKNKYQGTYSNITIPWDEWYADVFK